MIYAKKGTIVLIISMIEKVNFCIEKPLPELIQRGPHSDGHPLGTVPLLEEAELGGEVGLQSLPTLVSMPTSKMAVLGKRFYRHLAGVGMLILQLQGVHTETKSKKIITTSEQLYLMGQKLTRF